MFTSDKYRRLIIFVALVSILAMTVGSRIALAVDLENDVFTHKIAYSGSVVDLTIPTTGPPAALKFQLKGGNGGTATIEDCDGMGCDIDCISAGGIGIIVDAIFNVGTGSNELKPGGLIRVIVGGAGEDKYTLTFTRTGWAAGGGGGGSAILYRPPGVTGNSCAADWQILMAAGGGGGA
jgi:hypothetical protein